MDRQVRWFAREIIIRVAQRLLVETAVAGLLMLCVMIAGGYDPLVVIAAVVMAMAVFIVVRLGASFFANPMNSSYLTRWPHPAGSINAVEQSNVGTPTDKALHAYKFAPLGALDEWGGASTNIYTRDSQQIIVATSGEDDLVVLSRLVDDRLIVTTTQLIPPHQQLVINQCQAGDVREVLSCHVDLLQGLTANGGGVKPVSVNDIMELLAIEWDAWNVIGPLVGPFVSVGRGRLGLLLQVRVDTDEMLERTLASDPAIVATRGVEAPVDPTPRAASIAPAAVAPPASAPATVPAPAPVAATTTEPPAKAFPAVQVPPPVPVEAVRFPAVQPEPTRPPQAPVAHPNPAMAPARLSSLSQPAATPPQSIQTHPPVIPTHVGPNTGTQA